MRAKNTEGEAEEVVDGAGAEEVDRMTGPEMTEAAREEARKGRET